MSRTWDTLWVFMYSLLLGLMTYAWLYVPA
jgi:hypothetical protein